jgi:hypothetical protein
MIRIKIVNGAAIEKGTLLQTDSNSCVKRIFLSLMNRYWVDKFLIENDLSNKIIPVEGEEYLGWPCGSGRICLMKRIEEEVA